MVARNVTFIACETTPVLEGVAGAAAGCGVERTGVIAHLDAVLTVLAFVVDVASAGALGQVGSSGDTGDAACAIVLQRLSQGKIIRAVLALARR